MKKQYNNLSIENLMKTNWINQFTPFQKNEIKKGLESKVNVSLYANRKYTDFQMKEIRLGLKDNIDVSVYVKEIYNSKQMKTIRKYLLEDKVDISKYVEEDFTQN